MNHSLLLNFLVYWQSYCVKQMLQFPCTHVLVFFWADAEKGHFKESLLWIVLNTTKVTPRLSFPCFIPTSSVWKCHFPFSFCWCDIIEHLHFVSMEGALVQQLGSDLNASWPRPFHPPLFPSLPVRKVQDWGPRSQVRVSSIVHLCLTASLHWIPSIFT